MSDILLKMEGIRKVFPGVVALKGASLELRRGEVLALMGENGAGKSTLMKCLFGIHRPEEGRIFLDGTECLFKSPTDAMRQGVAMVHQELSQAQRLTVADNLWLGRFPKIWRLPIVDDREAIRRTADILDTLGIRTDPRRIIGELTVSERQMVEIARAVSYDAKILVLDEPTSSLTSEEAQKLFSIISMLKERGVGIIYISHKMDEILRISDRVTVMRDGETVATEDAKSLTTERIIKLMVGRELKNRYPKRDTPPGLPLLEVDGLSGRYNKLKNASLVVRSGEVLGLAGLDGSGRSELLECIFGLSSRKEGRVLIEGKEVTPSSPAKAIEAGLALLTEERRAGGIFPALSIRENTVISSLADHSVLGFLSGRSMSRATKESIERLHIKTASEQVGINTLSGGNQQKVILGRWLLTKPRVLLLDEPTRGVDVGAKYEIYKIINELCAQGMGVLMVSSEMEELLGMCDRIAVMSGGMPVGVLEGEDMTQERIMTLAAKFA